jgi:hypothetical protein
MKKRCKVINASPRPVPAFTPMVIIGIVSRRAETMHMKKKEEKERKGKKKGCV